MAPTAKRFTTLQNKHHSIKFINMKKIPICYDDPYTADRYTLVESGRCFRRGRGFYWQYIAASAYPTHPCGIWQHGELENKPGSHLGKRVPFNSLPEAVQRTYQNEFERWVKPSRVKSIHAQDSAGVCVVVDLVNKAPGTVAANILWVMSGKVFGCDVFYGKKSVAVKGQRVRWPDMSEANRAAVLQWLKNNPV